MRTLNRKTTLIAGVAFAALVATPSQVWAQAQTADEDTGEVGEIIVRAQRIEQPLQKVPVAVQPVSGELLEQRKLNDLAQLQLATPSLQVQGGENFIIRGVGSLSFSPTVDSSAGVAVDEVSLGVPLFMSNGILDDVQQVEILMGPQGLLFGRNSSSGLVNVVTKRPELGEFSGRVLAEYDYRDQLAGSNDGKVVKATINVPLGSSAALRVNGYYNDQDSITNFIRVTGNVPRDNFLERYGFRAKLLIEPSDQLSIYISGDYGSESGVGGIFDRTHRFFAPGSLTGIFAGLDGVVAGPENFSLGLSGAYVREIDNGGVSANISYEVSDAVSISNIFAWRKFKTSFNLEQDLTSFDGLDVNTNQTSYRQISNELRLTFKPSDAFDGQAGLYYFNSRLNGESQIGAAVFGLFDPFPGFFDSETNPVAGTDSKTGYRNESYAAFGQVNFRPTPDLTLIAGGRVTHDKVTGLVFESGQNFAYPLPLGIVINQPGLSTSNDNTNFSWKLGAQYQFSDDVMGYATYSTGYKGPTTNNPSGRPGEVLAVAPETVRAWEFGLKTTLLDRKLRLNVSAFRNDFDNFQVQGYDPVNQAFFLGNAAKVRSQGFEFMVDAKPVPGLTINAAATILDTEFTSYPNNTCYPSQTAAQGCVTIAPGVLGSDSTGNRLPNSPKFTSTVAARYEFGVSDKVKLFVAGDWYHRSSIFFDPQNSPLTRLGGIDIFGASIGATLNDQFRLELFCKNCTNKVYPLGIGYDAIDGTNGIPSTTQTWGYNSVRTIGATLSVSF